MSRHIVLLGDSIFDNGMYVPGGPSVSEHLQRILGMGDKATLLAVDGARVASVHMQIERIPTDATHLVLSIGGNNALWLAGNVFEEAATDVRSGMQLIGKEIELFRNEYDELFESLRRLHLPLVVCSVYDSVPGLKIEESAGLMMFNNLITRKVFELGLPLIDLRLLCSETSDFSAVSPIEPSASGGGKIARAIHAAVERIAEAPFVISSD